MGDPRFFVICSLYKFNAFALPGSYRRKNNGNMALIDVVKCEVNSNEFVYKFPSDDLRMGTQLVVYPAQTAFFVKGGKICDEFAAGTYTISAENIPILNKLINIPFGGSSPFKAEVWFINQITKLDMKWGTPQPIQLEDPKYGIIVPVRSFGQYGIKITNPRAFMETLIGNMATFTSDKINEYFKGKIVGQLSALITEKMATEKVSVLNVNGHLMTMSEYCRERLSQNFAQYGIELVDFSLMSINVPQDDPSLIKLKDAIDKAAQLRIVGRDIYQMDRSFDVMGKAAANEGAGGSVANMGMGLGMGLNMGNQMGNMMSQNMNTNVVPPPLPQAQYYIVVNGQQQGPFDVNAISSYISSGQINANTLVWKQGMANWSKISTVPELANMLQSCPPPVPPTI